jgi:hypothetical protein
MRIALRANDKASGVYLVAPDRETRMLGQTLLGLTLLRLTHVAGDDAVSQCCCHQCLLYAVAHQQFKAGLVRCASCRDADDAKLHRVSGTRHASAEKGIEAIKTHAPGAAVEDHTD